MSPGPRDPLERLFDRTAEQPDQATLDRMARRAAGVPEQSRRRLPFGLSWPRWAAALAGAAALAAVAVVGLEEVGSRRDRAVLTAMPAAATQPDLAVGPDGSSLEFEAEQVAWLDDGPLPAVVDDPLVVFDADPVGDPAAPLELLVTPRAENLDAAIAAYERILKEG